MSALVRTDPGATDSGATDSGATDPGATEPGRPTLGGMRALLLEVPERLLHERRAQGLDVFDEVWEGVLHMVPPPSNSHQRLEANLLVALHPLVQSRGLEITTDTGVYDQRSPGADYRVPDLVVTRPEHRTARGVEGGAEMVVEILSPHDETYDKFAFYAAQQVQRVLVLDPTTCVAELYVLRGGELRAVVADAAGDLYIDLLDLTLATVAAGDPAAPALRLRGPAGDTVIPSPPEPASPSPAA